MTPMETVGVRSRGPRDHRLLVPAVTWLVAVGALAVLPALARTDPELAADLPKVGGAPWWVLVAAIAAQALVLAYPLVRARTDAGATTALLVVAVLALAVAPVQPSGTYGIASVAVIVAVYQVGVRRPFGRTRWVMLATVLLVGAGYLVNALPVASGSAGLTAATVVGQAFVLVLAPLGVAVVVRARRDVRAAQRRELDALARERDALVQAAVAEERTAIARELHDIAAHHMSGIAVMASAIERQIDPSPDEAKAGIRQVRDQSRVVLQDLRRLVGLMRDDEDAGTSVQSLAAVPELVALADRGDGRVVLHVRRREDGGGTGRTGSTAGLGAGIGPLAQLTAYRMVQEALANAARHAPGAACTVELDDSGEDAVVLLVRNVASAQAAHVVDGGGHGLRGMRERAELVGADLRFGPTVDGGWEVRLSIPRDAGPGGRPGAPDTVAGGGSS